MKRRLLLYVSQCCVLSLLAAKVFAQTPQLVPLTTFGPHGDGTLLPGDIGALTGDGSTYQRGMAYNPTTGHLIIASRFPTSAPSLNVVDGTTGADLGPIFFEPQILAGNTSFYLNKIAVSEDGSIYVGNLSSASTPQIQFVLYRYASETGAQTMVYFGDPSNGAATSSQSNGRWGDTMTVRGSGTNTQVLIASQGTLAAILRPTDESLSSFTATTLATDVSSGSMADSVSFGSGNTFWTKASGFALRQLSFDLEAGTATVIRTHPASVFPGQMGPIFALGDSNLLAGVEIAPGADFLKLYDTTTTDTPVFLDRLNYTTNLDNGLAAGEVCFGDGNFYALNADNGILAATLVTSNKTVSPSFFLQPSNAGNRVIGSNVTFSAAADGIPSSIAYQWYFNSNAVPDATNSSLPLMNLQLTNTGSYFVVATNSTGAATSSIVTLTVVPESILYLYEPFNYAPGQYLTNCTLAPGLSWTTNGSTAADSIVAPGNLTIPGLIPSLGNSFTNGGGGAAARLSIGGNQNSDSIYASFAMRINSIGAFNGAPGLIASFVNNVGNDQVCRLVVRTNGLGQFNLGVGKATTSGVFATNEFSEGETVFVVMRYTFVPGGTANDLSDVWLNPSPDSFGTTTPPAPSASAAITGTDVGSIDMWAFRQNSAANTPANIQYDELRIANKWNLVTPTAAVSVALSIARTGNSVVLSWPTSGSEDFVLESAPSLGNPASWAEVSESVVSAGGTNSVTLGLGSGTSFFRLRK